MNTLNTFYFSPLYFLISFAILAVYLIINRKYKWMTKDIVVDMEVEDGMIVAIIVIAFLTTWPFLLTFFLIIGTVYLICKYVIPYLLPK